MRRVLKVLWFLAVAMIQTSPAVAAEPVDANVITGLDVSSSINAVETQLQIDGMAQAIRSPMVVGAILSGELHRINFTVFVWADGDYPTLVSRVIASQADADAAAQEMSAKLQEVIATQSRNIGTLTNLSGALDHARALLLSGAPPAGRTLVNIVGNGEDNVGEPPERARAELLDLGVTINGVVIGGDPAVMDYYRHQVIGGKRSFVRAATKPENLVGAMISKFVSEIAMR